MIDNFGDQRILRLLKRKGSDLSKPHHAVYYLYFQSKISADIVAAQLREDYYTVHVGPAPFSWLHRLLGSDRWKCIVEKYVLLEEDAVLERTRRFNKIAAQHDGAYAGWEAGIVH